MRSATHSRQVLTFTTQSLQPSLLPFSIFPLSPPAEIFFLFFTIKSQVFRYCNSLELNLKLVCASTQFRPWAPQPLLIKLIAFICSSHRTTCDHLLSSTMIEVLSLLEDSSQKWTINYSNWEQH